MLNIDLQLFGGGGSKSGLGGGGGWVGPSGESKGGKLGYIIGFYDENRKMRYKWFEGRTAGAAEERATKYGKEKGMVPTTVIRDRVRKNDAGDYFNELKKKNKK